MKYQYAITLFFRNGKKMEILANQVSTHTDPNGVSHVLTADQEIIAELPEGIGNAMEVGEVPHYNAFPRPGLYKYFPKDWDPIKGRFSLIDRILIDSRGRVADKKHTIFPGTPFDPANPTQGC